MPEEKVTVHNEKILWVDTIHSSELEAGFQSRPSSELRRFEGMATADVFSFRGSQVIDTKLLTRRPSFPDMSPTYAGSTPSWSKGSQKQKIVCFRVLGSKSPRGPIRKVFFFESTG